MAAFIRITKVNAIINVEETTSILIYLIFVAHIIYCNFFLNMIKKVYFNKINSIIMLKMHSIIINANKALTEPF